MRVGETAPDAFSGTNAIDPRNSWCRPEARRIMRKIVNLVGALLLLSAAIGGSFIGRVVWRLGNDLPDHRPPDLSSIAQSSCWADGRSTFVPLAATPSRVRNAFLVAEEWNFYDRPPFNPLAEFGDIVWARKADVPAISKVIAQCLLNSAAPSKVIEWQIRNIILIYRIERDLSKDQILEIYLNAVPLGRGASGAGAAANAYFGKALADLTLAETAYIAGLAKAPARFGANDVEGTQRRDFVLHRMAEAGAISPGEVTAAKTQPLILRVASRPNP
jgi:penicillin-binding protein 1A